MFLKSGIKPIKLCWFGQCRTNVTDNIHYKKNLDSPFTVVDAFSLSYRYLPFLVDFFHIFTYVVWWGDLIFRRLLNWVRLLAVKWENKKTSPQNTANHVCWSFLLSTLSVILVLWLNPLIGKGDGGYLPAGWRGGLHSQFLYHWLINKRAMLMLR